MHKVTKVVPTVTSGRRQGMIPDFLAAKHHPDPAKGDFMSAHRSAMSELATRLAADVLRPLPGSRKLYVPGSRVDIAVPMRVIEQSPTPTHRGLEPNPSITVYDTSGPYTDAAACIDLNAGLKPLRAGWIAERSDSIELAEPSSAY